MGGVFFCFLGGMGGDHDLFLHSLRRSHLALRLIDSFYNHPL